MTKQEFFVNIVNENIAAGFIRGQKIFQESLNESLEKSESIENIQLDGYINALCNQYIQEQKQ